MDKVNNETEKNRNLVILIEKVLHHDVLFKYQFINTSIYKHDSLFMSHQ